MAADQPAVKTRRSIPNALRIVTITLGAVVLVLFLWVARSLFLTIFLAIVAGLALARAADWLEGMRIPRAAGAPLAMLVVLGAIAGLIALIAPTVREQAQDLRTEVPKALQKVEEWLGTARQNALGAPPSDQAEQSEPSQSPQQPGQAQSQQPQQSQPAAPQPPQQTAEQEEEGGLGRIIGRESRAMGRMVFPVISSTFEAIAGFLIIVFVAIYIAISPRTYYWGIMHLVPHEKRPRAEEVLGDLAQTLRGWLVARLIAMVIIGAVTAGGLALLGVRAAVALGLIAALLELIPFYGPILAAIPAIGIALVESPQQALWVALLYLGIQQLEGNLITPMLLKQRLEIPPVLTILAVSAFGIVFGVLGMLAAEPLMAATLVLVRKLYVRDVVGDDVD